MGVNNITRFSDDCFDNGCEVLWNMPNLISMVGCITHPVLGDMQVKFYNKGSIKVSCYGVTKEYTNYDDFKEAIFN